MKHDIIDPVECAPGQSEARNQRLYNLDGADPR